MECCDVLGNELNPNKDWYKAETKDGRLWIPAFIEYVDENKCIGCGLCIKICIGRCYQMKDIAERKITVHIGGKEQTVSVKKVAAVVNSDNCLGDCHCHMICPVDGGAMVCKPKQR